MENFDVADLATLGEQRTIYAPSGGKVGGTAILMDSSAPTSSLVTTWGTNTFTEKGMRRTSMRMMANFMGSSSAGTAALRLPLPPMTNAAGGGAARSYYASMRLRFLKGTSLAVADAVPLSVMDTNQVYIAGNYYPAYVYNQGTNIFLTTNATVNADGSNTKNRLFLGQGTSNTNTFVDYVGDSDGWFHIEIFKPVGSYYFTIWLNDFKYTAGLAGTDPNRADSFAWYLNLYMGRVSTISTSQFYGMEVTDVIFVDPATAGQQYRYGSSGRVLSLDYKNDVVNDWASASGATLAHYQMMMVDKSVPDATNVLTTNTLGAREQYGVVPIPSDFGPYMPVLAVKPRVANLGAAAHSIAMEVDWGSGNTEVASKLIAAGGAYDANTTIMTTKPNGDPWTTADFADAKAGFSVKS